MEVKKNTIDSYEVITDDDGRIIKLILKCGNLTEEYPIRYDKNGNVMRIGAEWMSFLGYTEELDNDNDDGGSGGNGDGDNSGDSGDSGNTGNDEEKETDRYIYSYTGEGFNVDIKNAVKTVELGYTDKNYIDCTLNDWCCIEVFEFVNTPPQTYERKVIFQPTDEIYNGQKLYAYIIDEKTVYLYSETDIVLLPIDSSYMFYRFAYIPNTNFLKRFDASVSTNMSHMFAGFGIFNIIIDLGDNFDTSNVVDMEAMFNGIDFSTINLGDKFYTNSVENMSCMFSEVNTNITNNFTLNLGDKFDTSNVTDMSWMFTHLGRISNGFTLNLGDNFDTSNVTNMEYMFSGVGVSSTEKINICTNQENYSLGNKFDTSKVVNVTEMFSYFGNDGYWMNNGTEWYDIEVCLSLGVLFTPSAIENYDKMFYTDEIGYLSCTQEFYDWAVTETKVLGTLNTEIIII